jgi:hypothetical protein
MKVKNRRFTKDEIRKVIKIWESKTLTEIAEEIDRSTASVNYISNQIRKAGYKLPKKQPLHSVQNLIKEVINELK